MSDATEPKPVTPLDEALAGTRKNPGEANYFFDAFLNADLYMPVQIVGAISGSGRQVGWDEKFQPLFLTYEGSKVIPLFDQYERLQQWSGTRSTDYLLLRCNVLLPLLAPEIAAIVNPGTDFSYYFPADILKRLRRAMRPVQPM